MSAFVAAAPETLVDAIASNIDSYAALPTPANVVEKEIVAVGKVAPHKFGPGDQVCVDVMHT